MAAGRTIMAVIGGVVAGGVAIALVEAVGHAILKGEAVFAGAAIGYGLGALVGTVASSAIAGRRTAIAVPVILAGLAAVNLFSFPHPEWFAPAALAALALGWLIGSSLGGRWLDKGR